VFLLEEAHGVPKLRIRGEGILPAFSAGLLPHGLPAGLPLGLLPGLHAGPPGLDTDASLCGPGLGVGMKAVQRGQLIGQKAELVTVFEGLGHRVRQSRGPPLANALGVCGKGEENGKGREEQKASRNQEKGVHGCLREGGSRRLGPEAFREEPSQGRGAGISRR
jgi:hypothetical protein